MFCHGAFCEIKNKKIKNKAFIHAIKERYQYEMWIDDLPLFGQVGLKQFDESSGIYTCFMCILFVLSVIFQTKTQK